MLQLALLTISIIIFTVIIFFLVMRTPDTPSLSLTYERNMTILTGSERAFINVFEPILSHKYRLFAKIRLADLIDIQHTPGHSIPSDVKAKIHATTVSFVICKMEDHSIVGIIDIEDKNRRGDEGDMPDDFIDLAAAEAGLPINRIPSKSHYDQHEIAKDLAKYITIPENKPSTDKDFHGNCPSCGEPLTLLKAKHGDNIGKFFLGCTNYPECKYLSLYNEHQNSFDIPSPTLPNNEKKTDEPHTNSPA